MFSFGLTSRFSPDGEEKSSPSQVFGAEVAAGHARRLFVAPPALLVESLRDCHFFALINKSNSTSTRCPSTNFTHSPAFNADFFQKPV